MSGTATVNFATFDQSQPGHASQKSDYEISLGKLTFAAGETESAVMPLDDTLVLEARVQPKDIAFIKIGDPANVKVTAVIDGEFRSKPFDNRIHSHVF